MPEAHACGDVEERRFSADRARTPHLTLRIMRSTVKLTSHGAKLPLHVISKSAWREAVASNRSLSSAIAEWYKVASAACWRNLTDVRKVYPSADSVGPYTVFNIKGNAFRLIVKIEYCWQMIFVKHLLTHAEYARKEWTK